MPLEVVLVRLGARKFRAVARGLFHRAAEGPITRLALARQLKGIRGALAITSLHLQLAVAVVRVAQEAMPIRSTALTVQTGAMAVLV